MPRKYVIFLIFFVITFFSFSQTTVKNGYQKFFYENGKISSEGNMKDGKPDGFWKNYYLNGKLKIAGNRKSFQL